MRYDDAALLDMVLETGRDLLAYLQRDEVTVDRIVCDQTVQWTVTTPLYNIGEKVYQLSDEFKDRHDEIPWARIAGMRHRLVHSYEKTNWNVVAATVLNDLPVFPVQVEELRDTL